MFVSWSLMYHRKVVTVQTPLSLISGRVLSVWHPVLTIWFGLLSSKSFGTQPHGTVSSPTCTPTPPPFLTADDLIMHPPHNLTLTSIPQHKWKENKTTRATLTTLPSRLRLCTHLHPWRAGITLHAMAPRSTSAEKQNLAQKVA
jgi:hypothetical protein